MIIQGQLLDQSHTSDSWPCDSPEVPLDPYTSCSGILLGFICMTMANQLNYINLNLKHLPAKYNSLQYSSGKKPKEDGKDREMAHGAQKTTPERVNLWEVNEIISLLFWFHLAFSQSPDSCLVDSRVFFSPTFYSFVKCDKSYFFHNFLILGPFLVYSV